LDLQPGEDASALRTLYIDLLERILTNTIYRDPDQAPWGDGKYAEARRDVGRDWPLVAHTMIGGKRLSNLRMLCERAIVENVPGDFIETGVWRGGACILMRGVLKAYGDSERVVMCADSFRGLPPPRPDLYPKDAGDRHHEFTQLAISLDEVRANFEAYGLLDEQVIFLEGLFKDTLPKLPRDRIAVARIDGDMYESTMQALENLYPRMSPGGFVIVDDYGAIAACAAAVQDFRRANAIADPVHEIDWTGIWWQVGSAKEG